jgi:hypothetical protein
MSLDISGFLGRRYIYLFSLGASTTTTVFSSNFTPQSLTTFRHSTLIATYPGLVLTFPLTLQTISLPDNWRRLSAGFVDQLHPSLGLQLPLAESFCISTMVILAPSHWKLSRQY